VEGGSPALGLGVGLTAPHRKQQNLRSVTQGVGPVRRKSDQGG
jgi:hypothetical protein